MSLRGERFQVDFDSDEEGDGSRPSGRIPDMGSVLPSSFVGDIQERTVSAPKPPTAPRMKTTATGFPEHKKRTRVSAFKQQRAGNIPAGSSLTVAPPSQTLSQTNPTSLTKEKESVSIEDTERQRIDDENNRRLAAMSAEEIDQERQELLAGLNPSLIERLLKRANLDEGRGDTGTELPSEKAEREKTAGEQEASEASKASKEQIQEPEAVAVPKPTGKPVKAQKTVTFDDDKEPEKPIGLAPVSTPARENIEIPEAPSIHFPAAPGVPELDPNDPSFLESLHTKYFPNLPADPSKLAWMAPIPTQGSVADQESPYYPAQEALPASAIRFDFRGGVLPPRIARAMPTNKGLHHHGEAPEAAGYTIPELARLARSAFPAQRCVAFQTLGRLLYRLGRGEWGDHGSEMAMGLWRCVEEGKVIETLEDAANIEGGHQGSKTYAVEAVWLWQKGGGQVWKAG